MALAYLLSPTFQFVNTAGRPLTGGYLEVYIAGSRDKYYCASDFNGTLHPFRIPLDSLGANVVLADDGHSYDVYAYNRYGTLSMSRYNVKPGEGGGISGNSITSSDGSIVVTPTADGVDLKVDAKPPTVMRCTASDLTGDGVFQFSELQRDGTSARVDSYAVKIDEGWWHYDATVRLSWSGEANSSQSISLYSTNSSDSLTFDLSYQHAETVHVSGEQKATQDGTTFVLGVGGLPIGMTVTMVDFGIHSIVGEGAGGKYNAGEGIVIDETNRVISIDPETVQEKLTPGEGISIDDNNVISVDESAINGIFPVTYDVTTVGEIRSALMAGKLPVLFKGDAAEVAISVRRIPIHDFFDGSTYRYAQFWQPYVYTPSGPGYPPYANFVVYGVSYDTATGVTTWRTSYKYFAEQSDWAEADATKLTFIKNRPDLSIYATQADLTNGLATKQDVISDLSDIRAGAAAGATAVQDPDYVHTDNNFTDADATKLSGIQAGAEVNVQANWNESDSSSDSFIQNKPGQTSLVAGTNITIVDDAQNNTVTISAAATQAPVQDVTVDNVSVVNAQGVAEIPSIPVIGTITL